MTKAIWNVHNVQTLWLKIQAAQNQCFPIKLLENKFSFHFLWFVRSISVATLVSRGKCCRQRWVTLTKGNRPVADWQETVGKKFPRNVDKTPTMRPTNTHKDSILVGEGIWINLWWCFLQRCVDAFHILFAEPGMRKGVLKGAVYDREGAI